MSKNNRELLEVLKAELGFVEKGGYRLTARASWRPQFIFQDSPTCLNFETAQPSKPCSDCVLMQVIPGDQRKRKIPCRHIPLNDQGDTIDSFYRYGTRDDLEAALRTWLRATIGRLEVMQLHGMARPPEEFGETEIHVRAKAALAD